MWLPTIIPGDPRFPPVAPAIPSKVDRLQSALSKRAYKAAALNATALNVLSLLTAYQSELCGELARSRDPKAYADIPAVTDLCLRVQRSAVQGAGQSMATMVLQKRARWLRHGPVRP